MTTDLLDSADLMTARPMARQAPTQVDDEADREWQEFLALGLRVELTVPGANTAWRNTPVLLSY